MRRGLTGGIVALALVAGIESLAPAAQTDGAGTGPDDETGTILGRVITRITPETAPIVATADQAVCGDQLTNEALLVDASGGVANAIVQVSGVPWPDVPADSNPVDRVAIANQGCLFAPRVQVARVGGQIAISSGDATLHSTHAYDDRNRTLFNIALPVPGLTVNRPLPRPGLLRVECDAHDWMLGWVLVTADRATVTSADGRFTLRVPAGTHELTVWHESLEGAPRTVQVPAGGMVDAAFILE